jgi:hypothetical protein
MIQEATRHETKIGQSRGIFAQHFDPGDPGVEIPAFHVYHRRQRGAPRLVLLVLEFDGFPIGGLCLLGQLVLVGGRQQALVSDQRVGGDLVGQAFQGQLEDPGL